MKRTVRERYDDMADQARTDLLQATFDALYAVAFGMGNVGCDTEAALWDAAARFVEDPRNKHLI